MVLVLIVSVLVLAVSPGYAQTATPVPPPGTATSAITTTVHVVQRGETLYHIAEQFGTTVDDIARANGISNVAQISIGQRLLIPNVAANAALDAAAGVPTDYIVGPGDSLLDLAWRYGTTIDQIALQNRIVNPVSLYVGLPLALQAGAKGRPQITNGHVYTVQPGDTLYRVAMLNGVSIAAIRAANTLQDGDVLFSGQPLVIPADKNGPALTDLPAPFAQFTMHPTTAEQGRTVVLEITTASKTQISGTFMTQPLLDESEDGGLTHHLLIGINATAKIGVYPLQLTATDATGVKTDLSRAIAIQDGGYNSEKILLPPQENDLLDPKVTQPEIDGIMALVTKISPKRYFTGTLGLPVAAAITSPFGTRRSYDNGPYDQFHTGNDFGAPPGMLIAAPAGGVVVFAGPLHVRGNATIIDHGWGVFTGYWHQSEILVHVGDVIQAGQIIGKVGSTGRATGPHLHWELFVGGVQVDSMQWTRVSFP